MAYYELKSMFEERAAIYEYEGGMTREEAEKQATKDIYWFGTKEDDDGIGDN